MMGGQKRGTADSAWMRGCILETMTSHVVGDALVWKGEAGCTLDWSPVHHSATYNQQTTIQTHTTTGRESPVNRTICVWIVGRSWRTQREWNSAYWTIGGTGFNTTPTQAALEFVFECWRHWMGGTERMFPNVECLLQQRSRCTVHACWEHEIRL